MRRIKLARFLQSWSDVLPRKYPLHARQPLSVQPFFVFGSGRNGSTLFNQVLNQHPDIFLPSEQYFLGDSILKYKIYNHVLTWRDHMKILLGELLPESETHTWDYDGRSVVRHLYHLKTERGLDHVLDLVYRDYALRWKQDVRLWGDSSAPNLYYFREIFSVFPKAHYFFLVRDGRDVVASYKKGGAQYLGEMSEVNKAIRLWTDSMDIYQVMQKRTRVMLVRYEDMVRQPVAVFSAVCTFLGLPFEEDMVNDRRKVPDLPTYREPIHENIRKPFFAGHIGSYHEVLTLEEISQCERAMVHHLKKLGYV